MSMLLSILIAGLVTGSIYALVASGLSLVWGTVGVFNFAQGALLMLGSYSAFYFGANVWGQKGLFIAIPSALLISGCLGVLLYKTVVKPFIGLKTGELAVIMATLAVGTFLENGAQQFFGPTFRKLPPIANGKVVINYNPVSAQQGIIMVVAPIVLIGFALFLKKAKFGFAVRAVSQNRDTALLNGIPVERIYIFVFFTSALLAGLAGVLFGGQYFVRPDMGGQLMLQAFIVVLFGGLGSLIGTVVSAYVIGFITAACNIYVGLFWTPVALFIFLFAAILIKPSGLMAPSK
jgi:branched-chain amino acid transport system permease protein